MKTQRFTVTARHEEYWKRVARLTLRPRSLSLRAAQIVIDAAMFGKGCIEGAVRIEQQKKIDKGLSPV